VKHLLTHQHHRSITQVVAPSSQLGPQSCIGTPISDSQLGDAAFQFAELGKVPTERAITIEHQDWG
jgi:hypothetical protein